MQGVLPQVCYVWCRRRDSNSHSFRHYPLKIACLPIPPRRHMTRFPTEFLCSAVEQPLIVTTNACRLRCETNFRALARPTPRLPKMLYLEAALAATEAVTAAGTANEAVTCAGICAAKPAWEAGAVVTGATGAAAPLRTLPELPAGLP